MTKKITLAISGMHCASCGAIITKMVQKEFGVKSVNVNQTTEKATIEFDELKIDERKLIQIIKSLNYDAKISNEKNFEQDEKTKKESLRRLRNTFIFSLIFAFPAYPIRSLQQPYQPTSRNGFPNILILLHLWKKEVLQ